MYVNKASVLCRITDPCTVNSHSLTLYFIDFKQWNVGAGISLLNWHLPPLWPNVWCLKICLRLAAGCWQDFNFIKGSWRENVGLVKPKNSQTRLNQAPTFLLFTIYFLKWEITNVCLVVYVHTFITQHFFLRLVSVANSFFYLFFFNHFLTTKQQWVQTVSLIRTLKPINLKAISEQSICRFTGHILN